MSEPQRDVQQAAIQRAMSPDAGGFSVVSRMRMHLAGNKRPKAMLSREYLVALLDAIEALAAENAELRSVATLAMDERSKELACRVANQDAVRRLESELRELKADVYGPCPDAQKPGE